MTDTSSATQALERYNYVTREVGSLFQQRALELAEQAQTRVSAYQQAIMDGDMVTNAKHAADFAANSFTKEIHKLSGDIDAYLVELRYLDQVLAFYTRQG
jgi:hypothetical protein